jgi:hypothetical protein
MRSFSDVLHKTPWWALLVTGIAVLIALAAFVTPYHIIDYRNDGSTPEERRAIKREIDNAFAENAIDIAGNVIRGMRRNTTDPARREELDVALEGLNEARNELREAGREAVRNKREALESTRDAARAARDAIKEARRQAKETVARGGPESEVVNKALDQSLKAAEEAEAEATRSLEETRGKRSISIGAGIHDKPMIDIDVNGKRIVLPKPPDPPEPLSIPHDKIASAEGMPPTPPVPPLVDPLPPEVRSQIRDNVTGDMYRIGIGAALALILIPMFILAIIAKFFIDRSRAATRLADLKRKEAEYARMSQQVTEAKLQALQAQVEPHFLYNTLASVQALTEVDPARANEMTGHLIQYLRNALPKMREGISTVGQEIELVRAYLSILQMRMGKRLTFDIAIPASLNSLAFPPLMLPSLVENAIKHGLEPQREGGSVIISAQQADGKLRLIVADTGRGFGETIGAGVGLANIRERLAALYGDAAKLTLEENSPRGVIATIEVPSDSLRAKVGAGAAGSAAGFTAEPAASEAMPRTRTARTLSAMATAERVWRKALSFTFVALVIIAAVFAGLGIFGVTTEAFPVQFGSDVIGGPTGALAGTAGILIAFVAVVIAIAIVIAVVYGLGFLAVGLLIFIPLMILVSLSPVLAPIVLAGLLIWWIFRKKKRDEDKAAIKVEPTMAAASPAPAANAAPQPGAEAMTGATASSVPTVPPVPPPATDRPL